ncbi:hypothetical protein [Tenacibaculum geojense]|uniref:Yip1 domain-containing protein n=1 Tax=Tenacibaculum geojense TaxID=915352 RepID=A0ABW3JPJ0_9FLAO
MNQDKINDLLFNSLELHQKKQHRYFLLLFVFPLIYFLLNNSFVSEVKTPLISVEKNEIILLCFPFIYAILLLISILQTDKVNKIRKEIENIGNSLLTEKILDLLTPISIIREILSEVYSNKVFGKFGMIVIFVPVQAFCLLFPFIFLGCIIYNNFMYNGEFNGIAVLCGIMGSWAFIPTLIKLSSIIKK